MVERTCKKRPLFYCGVSMAKRRNKKDKIKRQFCGYCGKWKLAYVEEFNKHQDSCEREAVMWYREKTKFVDDEGIGGTSGK